MELGLVNDVRVTAADFNCDRNYNCILARIDRMNDKCHCERQQHF